MPLPIMLTVDIFNALIIESIEIISYCKKKRPDEHTILEILPEEKDLSEVKL